MNIQQIIHALMAENNSKGLDDDLDVLIELLSELEIGWSINADIDEVYEWLRKNVR